MLCYDNDVKTMISSVKFKFPAFSVLLFGLCDKVHHKREVRFLLYLQGQIVT